MLYGTIREITNIKACPSKIPIRSVLAKNFPIDYEIPLTEVLDRFGYINALFCLRIRPEGFRFLLRFAYSCVISIVPMEFLGPPMSVIRQALPVLQHAGKGEFDTEKAHELANKLKTPNIHSRGKCREDTFHEAIYCLLCATYAHKYLGTATDFAMGACTTLIDADILSEAMQESILRAQLLEHTEKDDEVENDEEA